MHKDDEEWRPIPDWEGLYEASSLGRIRSVDRIIMRVTRGQEHPLRRRGQIMNPIAWKGGEGYLSVTLKNNGVSKTAEVQTFVCRTFHGPRPTGADAAHCDGDPSNNTASNLRWASRSENMRDAIAHGTAPRGQRHGMAKLTAAQVSAIRADRVSTNMALADQFGVAHTAISRIRSGHRWADLS